MNYQQEEQPSGYDHLAESSLGLDMSLYDEDLMATNVNLHGNMFPSDYNIHSTPTSNITELANQSLDVYSYVPPQAPDMIRRHSDFYPMSEGTMSPQYHSFALSQDPKPVSIEDKRAAPFMAAPSHGMYRQQRPSVRRFDSMPGTLTEENEHQSYQESSPDSMESYLRSPISPNGNFLRASTGVPQARKKRNKCTPEQSRQLELFFASNRNPTGRIREDLSRRIQMPERSVQVWFQNKRAKTKINEIKDGVPLEQRTTVSRERFSRSLSSHEVTQTKKRRNTHDGSNKEDSALIPLPSTSLCIGEWRRIKPLICLFSQRNQSFTWYLSSESVGFKLECPISSVTKITFTGPSEPTIHEYSEGITQWQGQLTLELSRPPQFYMEVFRSSAKAHEMEVGGHKAAWRQCTDFTEGKQATSTLKHIVSGSYDALRQAVMQLYEASGKVSTLIELQEMEQHQSAVDPLQAYNLSTSTSGFFSPSSQQLNFGDFEQSQHNHQVQPKLEPVSLLQPSPVRSVPNTGNSLDFTGLQIDSSRQNSFSVDQLPQPQRRHTSNELQNYSWMSQLQQQSNQQQYMQQDQLLSPLAMSWNIASEPFGAMSAPAYEVRSFAEQQQQLHRASISNSYPSLSASMSSGGDFYTPHGDAIDHQL
jgi:hypothetical protein